MSDGDMVELKRCPFCGGKAHYYDDPSVPGKADFIECEGCSAVLGCGDGSMKDALKLRHAWNFLASHDAALNTGETE